MGQFLNKSYQENEIEDFEETQESQELQENEIDEINDEEAYIEEGKPNGIIKVIAVLIIVILLGLGGFFGYKIIKNNRMKKSYEQMEATVSIVVSEVIPSFELGQDLNTDANNIPQELKDAIQISGSNDDVSVKYFMGDIDMTKEGPQEVTVTVIATDKYEQQVTKHETVIITILNEEDPVITLKQKEVKYKAEDKITAKDILDNILSVEDSKRGVFKYSETKKDGCYTVDTSKIVFDKPGKYEVLVTAYDGSRTVENTFTVEIFEETHSGGGQWEPIVEEPTQEEVVEPIYETRTETKYYDTEHNEISKEEFDKLVEGGEIFDIIDE